jgi:hypothetical protein
LQRGRGGGGQPQPDAGRRAVHALARRRAVHAGAGDAATHAVACRGRGAAAPHAARGAGARHVQPHVARAAVRAPRLWVRVRVIPVGLLHRTPPVEPERATSNHTSPAQQCVPPVCGLGLGLFPWGCCDVQPHVARAAVRAPLAG